VRLTRSMLAGIDLTGGLNGSVTAMTLNSNRITGLLLEPVFSLERKGSDRLDVRWEKVTHIVFATRENELRGIPQGCWVRLRNGDLLSGVWLTDPLTLATANGHVSLPIRDVTALTYTASRTNGVTISRRDGQAFRGTLANDDLDLKLDIGPSVKIYVGSIEYAGNDAASPTTALSVLPSNSNSTNSEGLVWIEPG